MASQNEWEAFTLGRSAARIGKPKIGIQSNGRFSVTSAAKEILGDYVLLLYNAAHRQIGFRPATEETKGAYPIRQQKYQENSYQVSGQAFIAYYNLDITKIKGLYPLVELDGMLVLQLPTEDFEEQKPHRSKSR